MLEKIPPKRYEHLARVLCQKGSKPAEEPDVGSWWTTPDTKTAEGCTVTSLVLTLVKVFPREGGKDYWEVIVSSSSAVPPPRAGFLVSLAQG